MPIVEWSPITEAALKKRISQGVSRMSPELLHLWQAIRIEPEKWQQRPYGEAGAGFWVVGLIGKTVVWYNDLEEGFNRSRYSSYGAIDDYWCNQDELEITVQWLADALRTGTDLVLLPTKPLKPFP